MHKFEFIDHAIADLLAILERASSRGAGCRDNLLSLGTTPRNRMVTVQPTESV